MSIKPKEGDLDRKHPVRFRSLADSALVVEFSEHIDPTANARVLALDAALAGDPVEGVIETLPTYRSLLVAYDPGRISQAKLKEQVEARLQRPGKAPESKRRWLMPVAYGGKDGMDLEFLAQTHGLTEEQVIRLHAGTEYRVYMIGFMPGYAYLGGLPRQLHTSRRKMPRQRTPAGGVGIGGEQSSISSVAAPSGWHFIGRCPARLFDPGRENPFLLRAGDFVRFTPISQGELAALDRRAEAGEPCATLEEDG